MLLLTCFFSIGTSGFGVVFFLFLLEKICLFRRFLFLFRFFFLISSSLSWVPSVGLMGDVVGKFLFFPKNLSWFSLLSSFKISFFELIVKKLLKFMIITSVLHSYNSYKCYHCFFLHFPLVCYEINLLLFMHVLHILFRHFLQLINSLRENTSLQFTQPVNSNGRPIITKFLYFHQHFVKIPFLSHDLTP